MNHSECLYCRLRQKDVLGHGQRFFFHRCQAALVDYISFATPSAKGPCTWKTIKLRVTIFLAYDPDPWSNNNKEPESRVSRIELHMPILDHIDIVYAKLHHEKYGGVFVVPVEWHNIAENGIVYVDNQDVIDLFWTVPTGKYHDDINSIWEQAGFQFRLVSTSIPLSLRSIPTHNVPSGKSYASDCAIEWTKSFNSKEGVDIYAVHDLKSSSTSQPVGIGNCFAQGYVLIKAGNPKGASMSYNLGFSGKSSKADRAILVGHEFGHYLGSLGHQDTKYDNLMNSMLSGWKLEKFQIDQVRNQIKYKGYNEKK